jgi:hypothetical protein
MVTLSDLRRIAQKERPGLRADILLYLSENSSTNTALVDVIKIFGRDDKEHVISLTLEGEDVGYITESDLSSLIEPRSKSLTRSFDNYPAFTEPGFSPMYRRYKCPYAYQSCDQYYEIIRDQPTEIPKCNNPQHPGLDMIPE